MQSDVGDDVVAALMPRAAARRTPMLYYEQWKDFVEISGVDVVDELCERVVIETSLRIDRVLRAHPLVLLWPCLVNVSVGAACMFSE